MVAVHLVQLAIPIKKRGKQKNPVLMGFCCVFNGARGGTRTRTTFQSRDFKSLMSTDFITRANKRVERTRGEV